MATKNGKNKSSNPTSTNSFAYGFKVHSLSQVNNKNKGKQSPKKSSKKSPSKNRNSYKQNKQHEQSANSAFSTASSSLSIELYSSSVTQLLDDNHLNASSATSLHDLQCGTATVALQAFLSYRNLRRVFGIEQNKNLFHWATKNLMSLIKNGHQNNKYLLVEQIPSTKMTIAQKSSEQESEQKKFRVGEVVYAFIPLKQNNIKKRDNYQGIIRSVNEDGIHYDVEMAATKKVQHKVHKESIFKPGTERTFEIVRGNLFERSDSFRSDIILLPYSISNDSFRSLLLTGCKRSSPSSRILSFSHLESWDGFPSFQLRRVDANVYDNDRYDTNLSPHQKLYLYQHVLSPKLASSPKDILTKARIGSDVTVRDPKQQQWFTAKVLAINDKTKSIMVEKDGFVEKTGIEEIKIDEQRIHLISRIFKIGDLITAYCTKMIDNNHDDMYSLYRAQVIGYNKNGTYSIQYEDGENIKSIHDIYMFNQTQYKYEEGEICIAYRYDKINEYNQDGELINIKQNKNIQTNQCIIRHRNPDGTYRVEFMDSTQYPFHDSFCESWLKPINDTNISNNDDIKLPQDTLYGEPKLPLVLEIDYDKVLQWRPNIVAHWFNKCGINKDATNILQQYDVNGVFLFELDIELLTDDMKISKRDANQILRYMRALRSKMQYNVDEDDEEIAQISLEIQECDREMKHIQQLQDNAKIKLDKLIKSNNDEYKKYKDWELKQQCIALKNKKLSNKEIAAQLNKNQSWVKKTSKLKANQIKKPGGNAIKQIESLQSQILKFKKQIKEKQNQMLQARTKLQQYMDD